MFNKEGRLLIYFGGFGAYPGQFQDPYGIAIDRKSNRVITSEQYQGRVQMFRYVTDAEADQLKKEREATQAKNPAATTATANAVTAKDGANAPTVPPAPKQ